MFLRTLAASFLLARNWHFAWAENLDDSCGLLQLHRETKTVSASSRDVPGEYPWFQRGKNYRTDSSSSIDTAPVNFSHGPLWTWANEDDEQVRHSPLIDNNKDIYVSTGWKIRKFNSNGDLLWTLDTDHLVSSPALYEGAIYAVTQTPTPSIGLIVVDMTEGTIRWNKTYARQQDGDASSVFVYNNTVVFPVLDQSGATFGIGPMVMHNVYAVSASDGSFLWEFAPDDLVWNFAPSSPGDGTLVFSGSCGRVYRLTFEGMVVWQRGVEFGHGGIGWCGNGGGAVGINGVFYAEYNEKLSHLLSYTAHVSAYKISDGQRLWTKDFPSEYYGQGIGNQYPAVGKIQIGNDMVLAVVAAIGAGLETVDDKWPERQPEALWKPNAVVAMNAETGQVLWRFDEPKWPHKIAAGDDKTAERQLRASANPKTDTRCLPDPQGIPLIAGDGTVYMSSSHSGDLRAIKDNNGDGVIDSSEVSVFSTGNGFLNSPSLAQGMLVAAPCWGPMHVFKS